MADPESLSAGMVDAPDIDTDDEALPGGADEAVEGDAPDPGSPDVAQERAEREARLRTRKMAQLFESVVRGDDTARAELEADKYGRRLLRARETDLAQRQATLPGDIKAENDFQYWTQVRRDNPYEFTQALENSAFEEWYFRKYPAYKAGLAEAQSRAAQQPATGLDGYVQKLLSRASASVLTEADREALDADNYDHLDPDEARAEIAEQFSLLVAKRAAKARVAPEEARRQRQAAEAEGVENAIRNSAPMVQGRPAADMAARRQSLFQKYENDTLSPDERQEWLALTGVRRPTDGIRRFLGT